MSSVNDVTQDRLVSKKNSNKYRENWDKIFKKKEKPESDKKDEK